MRYITRRRLLVHLAAGAALAPGLVRAQNACAFPELEKGGLAIYFRHGATTWSGVDRLEWPRERQRLLSEEGIRQSEQIGAAFRRRGIGLGEILASPFARCSEMAEIAFGRVENRMELVGLLSDAAGREDRVAYLQHKLSEPPQPGLNRIIISHTSNIAAVADVYLAEGQAVVLRPTGSDGFEILGTAHPEDW